MTEKSPIQVVCHRGANEYAPENTYASAEKCIEWGVDYIEVDVNTSRDRVLHVFHGPDLSRTTNATGNIYDYTAAELGALDAGSWFHSDFYDQRIPQLEEFLIWLNHRVCLFFDVKWARLDDLIDLVYRLGYDKECFFWFGRDKHAREFRLLDDSLPLKINVSSPEDVLFACEEYAAKLVEVRLPNMSQELKDICAYKGVRLMIMHTENDTDAFRQILKWDVDLVNLDHGDAFLELAKEYYSIN